MWRHIILLSIFFGVTPSASALTRRIAVIVGANQANSNNKPLRYAHADAKKMEQVLIDLASFQQSDVTTLLDPSPDGVLAAIDKSLIELDQASDSLLLFYYSGHADAQSLYPNGQPLPLTELRKRLESPKANVRIGMIDACRGGGWTGSKGLSETQIFRLEEHLPTTSEGMVLIASSSGLENAHESSTLHGSYFTHHWSAALRGVGDLNNDGIVALSEAFEYAKVMTIRDTAIFTAVPQHPSFHMNLKGRSDLPISTLGQGKSALKLIQDNGPLSILHLASGIHVADTPPGQHELRIVVPPGRYLVRRSDGQNIWAQEIEVLNQGTSVVYERQLPAVDSPSTAAKNAHHHFARPQIQSTLKSGQWEFQLRLGGIAPHAYNTQSYTFHRIDREIVSQSQVINSIISLRNGLQLYESDLGLTPFGVGTIRYGITDRLQWDVGTAAFTYLGGEPGGFEWIVAGGIIPRKIGTDDQGELELAFYSGGNIDFRWWFSPKISASFGTGLWTTWGELLCSLDSPCDTQHAGGRPTDTTSLYDLLYDDRVGGDGFSFAHELRTKMSLGFSYTFGDSVTLSPGIGLATSLVRSSFNFNNDATFLFGSTLTYGMRSVPLVQFHLSDTVSIDSFLSAGFNGARREMGFALLGGFTLIF